MVYLVKAIGHRGISGRGGAGANIGGGVASFARTRPRGQFGIALFHRPQNWLLRRRGGARDNPCAKQLLFCHREILDLTEDYIRERLSTEKIKKLTDAEGPEAEV
jgi:hypothetical protein